MIVDIYQLHLYLNRCTGQLALETPEIPIAVLLFGTLLFVGMTLLVGPVAHSHNVGLGPVEISSN